MHGRTGNRMPKPYFELYERHLSVYSKIKGAKKGWHVKHDKEIMKRGKYRVMNVGDIRRGTSERTGMEWQAQDVVLEEVNDEAQYPENFSTSLQGSDAALGLRVGDCIECTPFLRARIYNDRYYNEVRVKNVVPLKGTMPQTSGTGFRPFGYAD
jgi:hypothetical protein